MENHVGEATPILIEITAPPALLNTQHPQPPAPVDTKHLQAVDDYFAKEEESAAVLNLVGLWTTAALLTDVAAEHLDRKEEERSVEPRLPVPEPK